MIYINRALGYYEVAELSGQREAKQLLALSRREEEARQRAAAAQQDALQAVHRPDTSQMVPFKPKMQWVPGEHVAPGKFPPF